MARTVAFSQQGEPVWMTMGRRWIELAAAMDMDGAAKELKLSAQEVRTVKRYARAVQFLEDHYLGARVDRTEVLAGSVAVLELAKLHQLAPALAAEMAPAILEGKFSTAEVRAQVGAAIERHEPIRRKAQQGSSVWLAKFRDLAFDRLAYDRLLDPVGRVAKLHQPKGSPAALGPDFVATLTAPEREMAITVRAPRDIAAKSHATVAAQLISNVATLLLRYDLALLVLPTQAEGVATAAVEVWDQWVKPDPHGSCRMYVMLLGENDSKWIRCSPGSNGNVEPDNTD